MPLLVNSKQVSFAINTLYRLGYAALSSCNFEAELQRRYGGIDVRVWGRVRLRLHALVMRRYVPTAAITEGPNIKEYNVCTEAGAAREACTAASTMQQTYSVLSAATVVSSSA